ncbi:hypothetical protein SMSKK35_4260 [Stenotrophomonas maltophilia SKK35]|nr:hypothetical protein SMSKK35_4260 [Stenotrophomonas maltophilia SKK35]
MRPTVAPAWRRRAGTWTKVWWKGFSSPAANLPSWCAGKSGRPDSFRMRDAQPRHRARYRVGSRAALRRHCGHVQFCATLWPMPAGMQRDDHRGFGMKGETVARVALWLLWSLWALACIVLLLGAVANHLASRTQTLPLVLQPGASAEITVYRFIDDPLRLRLRYADDGADPLVDPELRLRAETPTDRNEFRADTRSPSATAEVIRALESVEPDRFAASYFGYGRGDALPRGRSWLRLTVLAVDPALAGRAASVDLLAPMDVLKLTDLDYLWLWPFFFWPPVALLLLIAGGGLAAASIALRRWRRRPPPG